MYEEQEDNLMMEILHRSCPDRTDKQIIPIGLVFCGVFWGEDYRFQSELIFSIMVILLLF